MCVTIFQKYNYLSVYRVPVRTVTNDMQSSTFNSGSSVNLSLVPVLRRFDSSNVFGQVVLLFLAY